MRAGRCRKAMADAEVGPEELPLSAVQEAMWVAWQLESRAVDAHRAATLAVARGPGCRPAACPRSTKLCDGTRCCAAGRRTAMAPPDTWPDAPPVPFVNTGWRACRASGGPAPRRCLRLERGPLVRLEVSAGVGTGHHWCSTEFAGRDPRLYVVERCATRPPSGAALAGPADTLQVEGHRRGPGPRFLGHARHPVFHERHRGCVGPGQAGAIGGGDDPARSIGCRRHARRPRHAAVDIRSREPPASAHDVASTGGSSCQATTWPPGRRTAAAPRGHSASAMAFPTPPGLIAPARRVRACPPCPTGSAESWDE